MPKFIKLTDYQGRDTLVEVSHVISVEHQEDEDIGEFSRLCIETEDRLVRYNVLETVEEVWQKLRSPLVI